jgi:hypothetical protein
MKDDVVFFIGERKGGNKGGGVIVFVQPSKYFHPFAIRMR